MKQFDICVLGLGYIGVPTATIFANCGKKVLGVDVSQKRVDLINSGKSHVGEEDIDRMLEKVVKDGALTAATAPASSDFYIIAVPTPFLREGEKKLPDLSFVESAARSLAPCIENGQMVVLESTSPVGTTRKIRGWIADELRRLGRDSETDVEKLMFAHCPERILPGQMLRELIANDRIVGGMDERSSEIARDLYKIFCNGEIFTTDDKTAEMAKLTENASRDVNIAFANELSIVCDKLGINVWELIRLANRHPRVRILNPGPGVGGHCIAVDPWFIISAAEDESRLMRSARNVNDSKPFWVIKKVFEACGRTGKDKPVVACLGLTFKANVNDMRESPALEIAEILAESGRCGLLVVEPHVPGLPKSLEGKAEKSDSLDGAIAKSDIVLLLVEHADFANISGKQLAGKIVLDTKGFLISTKLGVL